MRDDADKRLAVLVGMHLVPLAAVALLLLGCSYRDQEAEAQAKAFAARMGVERYECGETSWAEPTFCNGIMGKRPVRFLCGDDGCAWWGQ